MTQVMEKPIAHSQSAAQRPVTGGGDGENGRWGPPHRLNSFQVLMRRWSRMHPYSAGQVMEVTGAADCIRWKNAVERVIRETGLGRPRFQKNFMGVEHIVVFAPVEDIAVDRSDRDLEAFFNEELNRRFAPGDLPIRFCVLPGPPGSHGTSHYFAAVYDHWIADSRAMRDLMQRIFERYRTPDAPASLAPLTLDAPGFKSLFGHHVGQRTTRASIWEGIVKVWQHRKAYRLNLWDPLNFKARLILRELPEGLIERLYQFAKSRGASVNDLFIAVLAQTMGQYTAPERIGRPPRPLHFARRQVGIGTIVDIRDAARTSLEGVFRLFLSNYTVLLENPEQRPVDQVMMEVAAETSRIKRTVRTVRGYWALSMVRFSLGLYDELRFQATLLHKTVPVVGGLSNVNMTRSWVDGSCEGLSAATNGDGRADPAPARVLDYLRISPAGPLIPLVFTLTTIGTRLSLCVTYRTQAFHDPKARELVEDFVRRLSKVNADQDPVGSDGD